MEQTPLAIIEALNISVRQVEMQSTELESSIHTSIGIASGQITWKMQSVRSLSRTMSRELMELTDALIDRPNLRGTELRRKRGEKNFPIRLMAKMAGISVSTYHGIESGTIAPSLTAARALASGLGCTVDDVFPPGS